MAKKIRRMTALVLALVMCASQLAIPSVAAEGDSENVQTLTSTSTVTDPKTGVTTVTVTTEKTNSGSGTTTTTTQTTSNGTDPQTGASISGSGSKTESTYVTNDGMHQQTNTQESSSQTTTEVPVVSTTGTNNETEVTKEKETVENSTGSSQESVDINNLGPGYNKVVATENGEKETETTTTTTTTEVTEDVKNNTPITEVDPTKPDENPETTDNTTQTGWKNGDLPDEIQWKDTYNEGKDLGDPFNEKSENKGTVTPGEDLTNDKDVVMNLTPTNDSNPDAGWIDGRVDLTTQKLANGEYPEIFNPAKGDTVKETKDGWVITHADNTTTVLTANMKDGKLNGWTFTTVTEHKGDPETGAVGSEDKDEVSQTSTFVTDKTMEIKVTEGKQTTQNPDGTTTETTVEKIVDKDGKFEGYRTVEDIITVVESGPAFTDIDPVKDKDLYDAYYNKDVVTTNGFKPVADVPQSKPATKNPDGTETTIVVEPIYPAAGSEYITKYGVAPTEPIGYKIISTTTGENNMSMMEEKEIYGTTFTETVTTITDPKTLETHTTTTLTHRTIKDVYTSALTRTMNVELNRTDKVQTTVVTEKDTYNLVETAAGSYFLYQGKMYAVVENDGHGSYISSDTANLDNVPFYTQNGKHLYDKTDDIQNKAQYGDGKDMYTGQITDNTIDSNPNTWERVGHGLVSGLFLKEKGKDGKVHQAQQFLIKNGNETRVVYCVELGTEAKPGVSYDPKLYEADTTVKKENKNDNQYWNKYVDELRSVCLNGFWGTEDGTGSLEAVREFLRLNGQEEAAKNITAGEALAATQAAIWEYGSSSNRGFADSGFVSYSNGDGMPNPGEDKVGNVYILRKLLIDQATKDAKDDRDGAAQAIEKESITGSSISLKEKVSEDPTTGNGTYNADLGFTLDVSRSSLNGNLVVTVTDAAGNKLGKYRLSQNSNSSLFDGITGTVRPMADGSYMLEDIQLTENVKITLKLEGTQHLDEGIYIYNNPTQQDFVGLSSKEHNVNLQFDVEFKVEDPSYQHQYESYSQLRNDTITNVAKTQRTDTATKTRVRTEVQDLSQETRNKYILSTITKVEVLEEKTKEKLRWANYYEYLMMELNDEDPETPAQGNELIILDEEVPLAAAPRTGDNTMLWALVTMLALAGAAALSINPKRKVR